MTDTSSSMTRRQSPTIGTSGRRTLPSSAGSMSTWMILASGANASTLPVIRSSKRLPERDEQVGALHRGDRRVVAVHARHAEAERVRVGEGAAGHQRGDDVDVAQLGQLAQRLGGPGLEDAAAGVDHRALGAQDQLGRLADLAGVALGGGLVAGQARPARRRRRASTTPWREFGFFGSTMSLGMSSSTGPGPAGGGDVERLADGPRDVGRRGDQLVVLGDRPGDADRVALLEGVGADGGRPAPGR